MEEVSVTKDGIDITSAFQREQTDRLSITNTYDGQELKISKTWRPEPEGEWSVTAKILVFHMSVDQHSHHRHLHPQGWEWKLESQTCGRCAVTQCVKERVS